MLDLLFCSCSDVEVFSALEPLLPLEEAHLALSTTLFLPSIVRGDPILTPDFRRCDTQRPPEFADGSWNGIL